MKQLKFAQALMVLSISISTSLLGAKAEVEGKAWLDAQKDPAEMNVNGTWDSEEWGDFHLVQAEGSRDVTGNGGDYKIVGVVSGKRLFLLFVDDHNVDYRATLSPNGEKSLIGTYDRKPRLHSGSFKGRRRPMNMKRQ